MAQKRTMVILLQYLRNTFKAQAGFLFTNAQNIIIEILDKIFNPFVKFLLIISKPIIANIQIPNNNKNKNNINLLKSNFKTVI